MVAVDPEAAVDPDVVDEADAPTPDPEFLTRNAEPESDDGAESDDRIDLVRSGLVRVWIGGQRFRLRRPFFGEFRTIRMSLQEVNDEVNEAVDDAAIVSRQLAAESKDVDIEADPEKWAEVRKAQRQRTRDAQRSLNDVAENSRLQWWNETWDLLTLDGRPSDWPSWITDPALANAIVVHWRTSPLGRG